MKKWIKGWLDIKPVGEEILKAKATEITKEAEKAVSRLDWFMREYHASICDGCGKGFLAHYGGFYRSVIEGKVKVHCSGACLDKTTSKQTL